MVRLTLVLLSLMIHSFALAGESSFEFFQAPEQQELQFDEQQWWAEVWNQGSTQNPLTSKTLQKVAGKGNWAFQFIWIKPDGTEEILSDFRTKTPLKPASTLKLFTGWMTFQKQISNHEFLSQMMKNSDNAMASVLLKSCGGINSFQTFYKDSIGLSPLNFKAVDGSGLSHANRVTVGIEIELLKLIFSHPDYTIFRNFLSTPQDGTLAEHGRFQDFFHPLFAKTGTLRDTASLAGFVELPHGTLLFSMISNQLKITVQSARKIIDQTVIEHVEYLNSTNQEITLK